MIGLTEKADAKVKTLSGGQQRRLDVGLGIVGDPALLILDEPTTGLDPAGRRMSWELFDRLARECSGLAAKREAEKNVADAASTRLIPAVRISRVAGSVSWRSGAATHPRQPSPSAGPSPDSAHAPGPGD